MLRPLLLLLCLVAVPSLLPAQTPEQVAENPTAVLPDSPLKARLRELAVVRPPATTGKQPAPLPPKELLRPELAFRPKQRWVLLYDLAQLLGSDDEQRETLKEVLTLGADAAREAMAGQAEGADRDVGVAAALFVAQLWQFARNVELSEVQQDRLHAQVAMHLATAEVGAMRDTEKQRVWEFCIGYPMVVATLLETAADDAQRAPIRKLAAVVFESLLGVPVERVEIGDTGLVVRGQPAKPAEPTSAPANSPAGASVPGVSYTDPPGWTRTTQQGHVIFRASLGDVDDQGRLDANNDASHQATIGVLPILTATQGATALFERTWREQFAAFDLGDTVAHYRSRLQSKLVVLYMGRFFARPGGPDQNREPKTYGGLWLVDLGGGRYQPFVALVEPRDPGLGMDMFKEGAALKALSFPLAALLDSIRPTKGTPPYPAGGYFTPAELCGTRLESSSAYGGTYVNSNTGAFAGAAVTASGGHFYLRPDGTYEYAFSYYSSHPQFGNQGGSTNHAGRYTLDGDIVKVAPEKPLNYQFTCCATGTGVRQTPQGPRRLLLTVSANRDGAFLAPPLIANWEQYQGVMTWYVEDPDAK